MGRTSKRQSAGKGSDTPASAAKNQKSRQYKAGIYARLSADIDKKVCRQTSKNESVEVQIEIAKKFIEEWNGKHTDKIEVVDCYIDLGKTGTNFNRGAFQRLMQDVRMGDINCVIVKDLSRFGRNYLEAGNYIEKIFPFLGVRFIAVADGFDTGAGGNETKQMVSEIKNLVNDMYAKDFSVKAKASLAQRRKEGSYVGGPAPYGYKAVWEGKVRRLIPDENTEEIVRYIFQKFIETESYTAVADDLNTRKINPPAVYHKTGEVYCPPDAAYKGWDKSGVERIIKSDTYAGKLVQGKTRRLDYRSKKKMNVPMRDWVIVDNTHEAIIPAEQFELVRRILETETRRPNDAETVALFAGFLYCGDCGSRLVRRSASYKGKRYVYYQCSGSKQNKGSCTSHNLRDEKLYNIVRNALQMQIQIVMEEAEFVESIRQAQQEPYRVRRIERQIRQLTAEKAHTQGIKEKLYGDYAEEILTREDFLNYNELYSKRIEEYDRKITELEAEQRNLQTAPNAYPFLDVYRKYRKLEEITRPMIVELIEKIEVYEGNRVEITFRFQDEIADLLEELHQKQMGQQEVSA